MVIVGGALLMAFLLMALSSFPRPRDYSSLVELLRLQHKEEAPLYAFNTFEHGLDEDGHALDLRFFNEHPALVSNIRRDLGDGEIAWRLEHSRHRLLFVPERREKLAGLFQDYCAHVIDYTLRETKLENPYVGIVALAKERPELPKQGVSVFLVHNLAEEVVGTYVFSSPIRKSLKIDLSRKTFLGEVGSYTTNICFGESGEPEIERDRFTIWQTTARNPFTVLSVPVEETLHIALREHTHRAIQEQLEPNAARGVETLEETVDQWIAVEEALVGGVMYALLPPFLETHAKNLPNSFIEEDIESRGKFKQYTHLRIAIQVVDRIGHEEAIRRYADHPKHFKALLGQPSRPDHS
jgi:hypothetical protein